MNTFSKIISLSILICLLPNIDSAASDMEYGPYEVGFKSYKTYDNSRPYLLGQDTISRPLLVHLWYPSRGKNEGHTLDFKHYINLIAQRENFGIPASEIDGSSYNYVKAYSDFAKAHLGLDTSIHTREILDAPVYAKSGIPIQKIGSEFPLLIYAPSNSKASVQNHMICEYLASHGFMILSVASAGPTSIQRSSFVESTMAQVMDMEHILEYCQDSLHIKYTKLGLFGFSSGGNANTIFQMRNESVEAVFSMDGGQEYGVYLGLCKMTDFNLEKAKVPYCALVNNYKDFSIYPLYNSVPAPEKYIFRMPYLNHNGFISHWYFFESCSPSTDKSQDGISYEYLSKCALGFFSRYLKPAISSDDNSLLCGMDMEYIQAVNDNHWSINALFNAMLNNNLDSVAGLMNDHRRELFELESEINILARMFMDINIDLTICLYSNNVEYHPDSWQAHFNLGSAYKDSGQIIMSKNELQRAMELNPENTDVADLLNEVNQLE